MEAKKAKEAKEAKEAKMNEGKGNFISFFKKLLLTETWKKVEFWKKSFF